MREEAPNLKHCFGDLVVLLTFRLERVFGKLSQIGQLGRLTFRRDYQFAAIFNEKVRGINLEALSPVLIASYALEPRSKGGDIVPTILLETIVCFVEQWLPAAH